MLIYPKAQYVPGPSYKVGYNGRYMGEQPKEGFVLHSMEGSTSAALGELAKPTREASWHFSVSKNGTVLQHYDPRLVCWHCGVAGDALPLTAAVGNVALIGIEHEGFAGEPLTASQLDATIELQEWCYSNFPTIKRPPALRSSHFEHGWLSGTSCPSGRIPWNIIIHELTLFLNPPIQEDNDMQYWNTLDTKRIYVVGATGKRHIGPGEWYLQGRNNGPSPCYQAEIDTIPNQDWFIPRIVAEIRILLNSQKVVTS